MKVEVQLFATLAPYQPPSGEDGRALLDVPPGTTVTQALRALGIPDEMPRIVLVNGHDALDDRLLQPDDVVAAFPPLAGGRASEPRWYTRRAQEHTGRGSV
ncbi:MAG: MoaD/ThiS family protein [Candidatus Rokubacteria bacterium]|nr:MoaD/ThiS family protein [Candidatus Rokubacteria bacterium]